MSTPDFFANDLMDAWANPDGISPESFPCFMSLLYTTVNKGQKGEEDGSLILENVIYLHPNNIPISLQQALVGILISFTTFSRLNFDGSLLTTFKWSKSTIAIQSRMIEGGNYVLYVLKMPNTFSLLPIF